MADNGFIFHYREYKAIQTNTLYKLHDGYSDKRVKKSEIMILDSHMRGRLYDTMGWFVWCLPEQLHDATELIKEKMRVELEKRESAVKQMLELMPKLLDSKPDLRVRD